MFHFSFWATLTDGRACSRTASPIFLSTLDFGRVLSAVWLHDPASRLPEEKNAFFSDLLQDCLAVISRGAILDKLRQIGKKARMAG